MECYFNVAFERKASTVLVLLIMSEEAKQFCTPPKSQHSFVVTKHINQLINLGWNFTPVK